MSKTIEERAKEASFQHKVNDWVIACFGEVIASDIIERNHRFIEEALELIQSTGATAHECHQLVDYVFSRPVGERNQELGGVMVTLAALANAIKLDMSNCGNIELERVWQKIEKIREKHANKPKHSPLPQTPTPIQPIQTIEERAKELWHTALTYAANVCTQISDEYNGNDHIEAADAAIECKRKIVRNIADPHPDFTTYIAGATEAEGWKRVEELVKSDPISFFITNIMRYMSEDQIKILIEKLIRRYPAPPTVNK